MGPQRWRGFSTGCSLFGPHGTVWSWRQGGIAPQRAHLAVLGPGPEARATPYNWLAKLAGAHPTHLHAKDALLVQPRSRLGPRQAKCETGHGHREPPVGLSLNPKNSPHAKILARVSFEEAIFCPFREVCFPARRIFLHAFLFLPPPLFSSPQRLVIAIDIPRFLGPSPSSTTSTPGAVGGEAGGSGIERRETSTQVTRRLACSHLPPTIGGTSAGIGG